MLFNYIHIYYCFITQGSIFSKDIYRSHVCVSVCSKHSHWVYYSLLLLYNARINFFKGYLIKVEIPITRKKCQHLNDFRQNFLGMSVCPSEGNILLMVKVKNAALNLTKFFEVLAYSLILQMCQVRQRARLQCTIIWRHLFLKVKKTSENTTAVHGVLLLLLLSYSCSYNYFLKWMFIWGVVETVIRSELFSISFAPGPNHVVIPTNISKTVVGRLNTKNQDGQMNRQVILNWSKFNQNISKIVICRLNTRK